MDAQDMGGSGCEGISYLDVGYDDDCFGDILNILDFPVVETLDGDGLVEDWGAKLGPIPSEVFREMLSPVAHIGVGSSNDGGGGGSGGSSGGSADFFTECSTINESKSQQRSQPSLLLHERKQRSFEAPSPDSVLERGSNRKTISIGTELSIPVKTRTKRSKSGSTLNPWLKSTLPIPPKKEKKKRRNLALQPVNEIKKCSHCEITKTPQWREGPMGPKTLCNACGVRYRSGRLFPEYRPAASPTFIPSVHSNSHRKVIEMRQKGGDGAMDDYFRKKVLTSNSSHTRLYEIE